jgi:hypothetical protein
VEKLKNENPDKLKEWRRNYYLKKKEKKNEIRNYLLFIFLTSIMGVLNVQRCKKFTGLSLYFYNLIKAVNNYIFKIYND